MPDIASWIYSLVLSLHNAFAHRMFNDMEAEKTALQQYFDCKTEKFIDWDSLIAKQMARVHT